MSFRFSHLSRPVNRAIEDLGFETLTDIQSQAIPFLLSSNDDFVGQAQTGTGKTAAFLLPLIERLNLGSHKLEALILTPTRELAHQVYCELEKFCRYLPVKATTIYGGVSYVSQIRALEKNQSQVVVGTPGRIIDLINRGILNLSDCSQLVIDEADEMLNMGFIDDVLTIINHLPVEKRLWMFSATMPKPIVDIVEKKFSKPKIVKVRRKTLSNENIGQSYCILNKKDFLRGLRRIYESKTKCSGIVFCETRQETNNLAEDLINFGVKALPLHGDLSQQQRDSAMKKFKEGKVDLLICTDVASRGIDVSHITHVFNMGLPRRGELYVHRIGRTGRAGEKGEAISFVTPSEMNRLRKIERLIGQKIKSYSLPEPAELKRIKVERELEKMEGIKSALVTRKEEFSLDKNYSYFKSYFEDLSKEQALKLLFSYYFKKDMRQIEEGLKITSVPPKGRSFQQRGEKRRRKFRRKW